MPSRRPIRGTCRLHISHTRAADAPYARVSSTELLRRRSGRPSTGELMIQASSDAHFLPSQVSVFQFRDELHHLYMHAYYAFLFQMGDFRPIF